MLDLYNIGKSYLFGENSSSPPSTDSGLNKGKRASNESYHSGGTPKTSVITPIVSVVTPISSDVTPIVSVVTPNKIEQYTTFPFKQENSSSVIFLSDIKNSSLMKRRRKKMKLKELSKHTNNKNRNRIRSV